MKVADSKFAESPEFSGIPKKDAPGCRSPMLLVFRCFGFDFSGSGKRSGLIFAKILFFAFMLANAYWVNLRGQRITKISSKMLVINFYFRTALSDVVFGGLIFADLLIHEKSLARFFGVVRADETKKSKTARVLFGTLSCLWILLAFVTPIGAILGASYPEIVVMIMMKNYWEMPPMLLPVPVCAFSMLFCSLYAFACFVLAKQLWKLARSSENLTLDELERRYRKIRLSVNVLEQSFSGVLPLLYAVRLGVLVVWTEFILKEPGNEKEVLARKIHLALHVFQTACLILPPIFVNGMLKSSLDLEINEERKKTDFPNAYTASLYEDKKPISDQVRFWTIQTAANPPRLTAGGATISAWLIVKVLVYSVIVIWAHANVNLLLEEIRKAMGKNAKKKVSK